MKEILSKLESLTGTLPTEFLRQPIRFGELKRWKSIEFRQFSLYTGLVVLKGLINDKIYVHFLAFSVAISIFLNKNKTKDQTNIAYANDLPKFFVQKAPEFNGKKFLVYNVHNVIHLLEVVEYFGEILDAYSCLLLENHLQFLKLYIRSSRNPISQIVKKISTTDIFETDTGYRLSICTVSASLKDSWFIHDNDHYVKVTGIGEERVSCNMYKKHSAESFYGKTCKSTILGIVYVREKCIIQGYFFCEKQTTYKVDLYSS